MRDVMNKSLKLENYGYQDFLLVKAPHSDVVEGVCAVTLANEMLSTAPPSRPRKSSGFVQSLIRSRLLAKDGDASDDNTPEVTTPRFTMHHGDAAYPVDLLTSERSPSSSDATASPKQAEFFEDIRISGLKGSDWVLVEYREAISGMSMLGYSLSTKLAGRDVLYFRRSGDLVSEYKNDFHVYQDGNTLRRVLCHSTWPEGDIEKEWWESSLDGQITVYEPEEIYETSGEMDLLDNSKLDAILGKLDLSHVRLFSRPTRTDTVLISRRSGGEALLHVD